MRIGVLFMQSQAFFGADSAIHAQLMRYLDRSLMDVHVACTIEETANPATSARRHLQTIPSLRVRPTNFGPSVFGSGRRDQLMRSLQAPLVAVHLLGLAGYIKQQRISIIHTTEKPRDAFYGVLLGKLTGAGTAIHMHVAYDKWVSGTVKWALGQAEALVAISEFVARSLADGGYARERIHVVNNALDMTGWEPGLDAAPVRRELGLPDDAPTIGIISRLFRWKGHDFLIEAMGLVCREFPDARLVIVGEDDPRAVPGSGSFRAELEAQAVQLGIRENVVFTGFRTDIARLMAAFDVFAHPSWEEPFGMVFLEAMAMCKPIVAWASGGAPEVIVQGETGLLAERGSVSGLSDALLSLLRDPELRHRLGSAGRRRAEQLFTPEQMALRMYEVYRAMLASSRPARFRTLDAQPR